MWELKSPVRVEISTIAIGVTHIIRVGIYVGVYPLFGITKTLLCPVCIYPGSKIDC